MAVFRFDAEDLISSLERTETKAQAAIRMYASEGAKKMESYAKTHRPWTDRTGMARIRLVGWVEALKDKVRIHIGHGVEYGIYLELGHEKKYAILFPTVKATSEEILNGYKELLKHLR